MDIKLLFQASNHPDVINGKSTQDIQSTQDKKENQNNLENNQEGVEA